MRTNENKCILASLCKHAAQPKHCNNRCSAWVSLHGTSGQGGRVAAANTPKDYRAVTLQNSPVRSSQPKVYRMIDSYVETFKRQFEASEGVKSLYLLSESPGTGKTTTAVATMNEWLVRHYIGSLARNRQALQAPAYFLDVNNWQSLFNQFNRSNVPKEVAEPAANEYYRRLKTAKEAPFAVLDDIGIRSSTEAFRADLHGLINHRVTNGLPTVYTSNVELEDLADVFDARLYDRIKDQCFVLRFEGESKRGVRK